MHTLCVHFVVVTVAMNLFFGLQCNNQPATLSTIWYSQSGLLNDKVHS